MALDDRHPDAERLAEYADDLLDAEARAEIERHLADCAECRAVVMETMAFLHNPANTTTGPTRKVVPFRSRRWVTGVAVGLATAAALVLAIRVVRPEWVSGLFGSRGDRPELQELIAAVANEPTRPVEGRLTGGFKYGPPPSPTRGPGDREVSPDVRIAAARIEKVARADDSPANRAALGVALLALGDSDKAVEALEEAALQEPRNAVFQSDLAAAYLARARQLDRAEDWPRALAAADRALKTEPRRTEALFNRALALEGLHLNEQALDAWTAYGSIESSGAWSRESADRIEALTRRRQRSRQGAGADHQVLREQIEDRDLAEWGRALLGGRRQTADESLVQATTQADALAMDGGDAMPRDEVALIRRRQAARDDKSVRELALAHEEYGRARASYLANRQEEAADLMSEAAIHFSRAGSAYSSWAPVLRAISLRSSGKVSQALSLLATVQIDQLPSDYYHLRGRLAWTEAVGLDELGRFDLGRERLTQALDQFQRAAEGENRLATQTILAEAEGILGDRAAAWSDIISVLEQVDRGIGARRTYHFRVGAVLALGATLPETALEFQNAGLRVTETSRDKAEAYVRRARTLVLLGDTRAAESDLVLATAAVNALDDRGLRERNSADLLTVRAELMIGIDSRRALNAANAALQYVPGADPAIRLATLLALRAKCREALNDVDGAEEDLVAAVDAFEQKRATLVSAQDRVLAFSQERAAFKELVRLEVLTRGDAGAALRTAERARAGVVLENWTGSRRDVVDPTDAYQRLAPDVAVVYYETLADRVLVWVLTKERFTFFSRAVPLPALAARIAHVQRLIRDGADMARLQPAGAKLFQDLIAPALELGGSKLAVFFVPDGPLHSLSFSALPDALGRPLVATRTVGVAPSLTTFLAASARLDGFVPEDVMAVGDGHEPTESGLPRLPGADNEAIEVGQLYPDRAVLIGPAASKWRIFNERRRVIHFAGHTVVNLQFPSLSRLLLAPGPGGEDAAILRAPEITRERFEAARVVVLATCEAGAGAVVEAEGVAGIAGAFFAAGVPSVVASRWPVDDSSHQLLTTFHRELRRSRDAASALRAAQLEVMRVFGVHVPVRAWAGFVALGGSTPTN